MPKLTTYLLLLVAWAIVQCTPSPTVEQSMVSLRLAQESQERSLRMLEMMAAQSNKASADGRIAESVGQDIQRYADEQRTAVEEQQQKLATVRQTAELYKSGNSTFKKREVIEEVSRAVLESSQKIRILEQKTQVIVDFLNSETFSKSEIGALFAPGGYQLIPGQVKEGERLFDPIVQKLYTFAQKYRGSFKALRGEIIVTGYSDATPVEPNSRLFNDLSARLATPDQPNVPTSADLNRKLSELRAEAVKTLLTRLISRRNDPSLPITVTVLGRGEEIPRGLPANVPRNDPRRRVVTFYWVVLPSL